ncbi:DUF4279 domain-containing protein [Wukongibacter baidiensis]|uniref:DUF4279 domain-containing protein n=1 Tax=Wukongibacter baidiensis TaxID=1723361 RepID=UPI003D7F3CFA
MDTNVNVEFVITGELFNPKHITQQLNIHPTVEWIKGDKAPNGKIARSYTCWCYGVGVEESIDINDQLVKILGILNPKRQILKEMKKEYDVEYLVLITIKIEDDIKPIMSIKSPIIEMMSDIDSEFDIDLYIY